MNRRWSMHFMEVKDKMLEHIIFGWYSQVLCSTIVIDGTYFYVWSRTSYCMFLLLVRRTSSKISEKVKIVNIVNIMTIKLNYCIHKLHQSITLTDNTIINIILLLFNWHMIIIIPSPRFMLIDAFCFLSYFG